MKYGHLDGQGLAELRGFNFQNLSSAPTTNLYKGRFYFNTVDNTLYVYNGTSWVDALSQGNYVFQNGVENVSGTNNVQIKIATGGDAGNVTLSADPNGLKADVDELEVDNSSSDYLSISNNKISASVDTTVTTSSTNLITSGGVATAIANAQVGAMQYKGVWTATSQSDYSSITLPVKAGYMYLVSGSATIGGIDWNTDDYLVINSDVAVGGTITDVKKIDNTEGSDIVRLNSTQTLTNKTIDADDNTITDLTTSNLKSGVLRTTIREVSSASDTSLVSEKGIAVSLAGRVYSAQNSALTVSGGICTWVVSHNMNNSNVAIHLYEVLTGDEVMFDRSITSSNSVTIKILSASDISADTYKVVILG